jgi:hypothetical protein
MDILQSLLTQSLDMRIKGLLPAEKDLIRSLVGAMGEAKIIEITNGKIHNKAFDVMGTKRFIGRIEVKAAFKPTTGTFGAWGLMCKRNKCDYFGIVEMSGFANNKYRVSMIPHDAMFEHLDKPNSNGKTPDSFLWSETYNETDKKRVEGTNLFLKYEVKDI